MPLETIASRESPREIIAADYKIELPIRGGWGYTCPRRLNFEPPCNTETPPTHVGKTRNRRGAHLRVRKHPHARGEDSIADTLDVKESARSAEFHVEPISLSLKFGGEPFARHDKDR